MIFARGSCDSITKARASWAFVMGAACAAALFPPSHPERGMARPGDPDDRLSDDDGDIGLPACMPDPQALARLAKYAYSLPGVAALIAAVSILVKELRELVSGDAGALDPRSSVAVALLGLVVRHVQCAAHY